MYCPHCGSETELVIPVAPAAAEAVDAQVRIAEINAARDIELARLARSQEREWNESREVIAEIEATAEVAAAEATAEVVAAVIAGPEETDDEPAPVVIDAPAVAEEETIEDAPPESDAPAPGPAKKSGLGLGMW